MELATADALKTKSTTTATIVRTRWLALDKNSQSRDALVQALEEHKALCLQYADAMFQCLDIPFDDSGETPYGKLLARVRSKAVYSLSIGGQTVDVKAETVVKALEVMKMVFETSMQTNVAVALSNFQKLSEYDVGSLLTELDDAEIESFKASKGPIELRKLCGAILYACGLLPEQLLGITSTALRSVIQNVKGKIDSLRECSKRHEALWSTHDKAVKEVCSSFGEQSIQMIEDLYDSQLLRSKLAPGSAKTIKLLLKYVNDSKTYSELLGALNAVDSTGKKQYSWTSVSEDLWNFFEQRAEQVAANFENGVLRSKTLHDDEQGDYELTFIDAYNEIVWLKNHKRHMHKPEYTGDDFGLHLGNNYWRFSAEKAGNFIHVAASEFSDLAFALGKCEDDYGSNYAFESLDNGTYRVSWNEVVWHDNGKSRKLHAISGILKEPKLCYSNGVLGIRMPINMAPDMILSGSKKADANSYKPQGSRYSVNFNSTKFAKPDSFKATLKYFSGNVAGFDFNENDQCLSVYSIPEINTEKCSYADTLDAYDRRELITTLSMREFEINKRIVSDRGASSHELLDSSVDHAFTHIARLQRILTYAHGIKSTYKAMHISNTEYGEKLYKKRKAAWEDILTLVRSELKLLAMDTEHTTKSTRTYDFMRFTSFDEAWDAYASPLHLGCSECPTDAMKDPKFLYNQLMKIVRLGIGNCKSFKQWQLRSIHVCDLKWLRLLNDLKAENRSAHTFGFTPDMAKVFFDTDRKFDKDLLGYIAGVTKQFRKACASFLQNNCMDLNVTKLFVEALQPPNRWISEDTESNKRRALLAPAELQGEIAMLLEKYGIMMLAVDGTLTSRVSPAGTPLYRARDNWHSAKYFDASGQLCSCDADENASRNIVSRGVTQASWRIRLSTAGKHIKVASKSSRLGLLMFVHDYCKHHPGSLPKSNSVLQNYDQLTDESINVVLEELLANQLLAYNAGTDVVSPVQYRYGDKLLSAVQRKQIVAALESAV